MPRMSGGPRAVNTEAFDASRRTREASVPEVADAGRHHRHAGGLGGGGHFRVADGAAGVDDGGDARRDRLLDGVRKREERLGGHDRAPRAHAGLPRRQPYGLHPVHLARTDPNDLAAAREDDGVRADKPADRPGKPEIARASRRERVYSSAVASS